jgi:energy-converting hydrogenase B subunit D
MDPILVCAVFVVMGAATVVVLTRDPRHQAVALGFYGTALGVLFVLLHAPDVALSQLAVGSVLVPFVVLFAIAKVQRAR